MQNVISYNEREVRQGYNIWKIPFGFAMVLAVMAATSAALLAFLKGKQWILVSKADQQERKKEKADAKLISDRL